MTDLDTIISELAAISEELDRLPVDAFGRRAELRSRRDALRAAAATLRSIDPEDPAEIRARLANLRAQLRMFRSATLSSAAAAQTGMGGGIDPEDVHDINRRMGEAMGIDGIRSEIARLERLLAEQEDAAQSDDTTSPGASDRDP